MKLEKSADLIETAERALEYAYARYSGFRVGAAIETPEGKIFSGANIEISSFGLTVCAERVAIFKAISEGELKFERLAVKAETDSFCPPCGACRQVLADFAPKLKIVLIDRQGRSKETNLEKLLPDAFNPEFLIDHKKG